MVGPREQVTVAGAFRLYMAVFVWRLYRDRFRYQLAINQLAFIISRIDFYFASGFKLKKVMDANTNITFEQMPQALAEVLSQVRLIKEAVMNGDNSRSSGRGSHVLVDIERACEITGRLGQFNDRVKVLLGRQVIAFPDLGACERRRKKAKDYPLLEITVSDCLEKNATPQQREMSADLADWVVEERMAEGDADRR